MQGLEVRPVNLGSNDRASMLCMPLCGFQVESIHWQGRGVPLIKLSTESSEQRYGSLMGAVCKDIGVPNGNHSKPGFLLDYRSFEFMTHPLDFLTPKFLNSRYTYSAFLFTLLFLRLSPQQNRMTFLGVQDKAQKLRREDLLKLVYDQYESLRLRLDRDDKPLPLGRYKAERGFDYIKVIQAGEVFRDLFRESGVQRLRIFSRVDQEDSVSPFGESTKVDPDLAMLMRSFIVEAQDIAAENERVRREATKFFVGSR